MELLRGTPAAADDFAGTMRRLSDIAVRVATARLRVGELDRTAALVGDWLREAAMTTLDARSIARAGLLERYRSEGRSSWLEATGRSMEPLIPAGSLLRVEFGALPERIGEIVLFRRADRRGRPPAGGPR